LCGLPEEFRLLLGFSVDEEAAVTHLNDEGFSLESIAAYLTGTYLSDSSWSQRDPWDVIRKHVPARDRSPEYWHRTSLWSAWQSLPERPLHSI
jgi:hypothetical protein